MTTQFNRQYELQVGEVVSTDLDIQFDIVKTLRKEPNTADITIFNLNPDNRDTLAELEKPVAQLKAGYEGDIKTIFLGDTRSAFSSYEPPDWVTLIEGGDGEDKVSKKRINKTFAPGTPLSVIIQAAATALGLGTGNLAQFLPFAKLVNGGKETINGMTLSGPAARELYRIVRSTGLEYSVQDSTLQFLSAGKSLIDTAVVLTPETGLIGVPTFGNDGVIELRTLLDGDIIPGRQLILESKSFAGTLRAERCQYTGATDGTDWYVDIEATLLLGI